MGSRWVRRRAHRRRAKSGGTRLVRATWELRSGRSKQQTKSYRHPCPDCGAAVLSVRMNRGGWAHFEGAKGLTSVKHACFHRGEGLGRRRDSETPDLFDERAPPDDTTQ
jgi:hypothetical protein